MQPVQDFRENFVPPDVTDTATGHPTGDAFDDSERHETDSQIRNVCFVWEDGRKAFFNYAYLVSVDLMVQDSMNVMLLYFSGQIVTLKGYHLSLLFDLLLNHSPKTIAAHNPRYVIDGQNLVAPVVTEIVVKSE